MMTLHQVQGPGLHNSQFWMLIDRLRLLRQTQCIAKFRRACGKGICLVLCGGLHLGGLRAGRWRRKILLWKHEPLLLLLLMLDILILLLTFVWRVIVDVHFSRSNFLRYIPFFSRGAVLLGLVRVLGRLFLAQLSAGWPPYRLLNCRAIRIAVEDKE